MAEGDIPCDQGHGVCSKFIRRSTRSCLRILSRRMLLSITNSCYDPLGLVSPITVQLKIELRKLYSKELGLSWDEDVPENIKKTWVKLIKMLRNVEGMKSRRCVHEPDSRLDPELIVFCDGSPLAMCSDAYIRWELPNGTFTNYKNFQTKANKFACILN